jgi:subtilase family serine protease
MNVRNPIVIAAVGAALAGATAAMPVSAGAAAGGQAAATTSTAGIGMPQAIVTMARHLDAANGPPTSAECLASLGVACYSPPQVERAYDLPPLYTRGLTGRSRTIVIVDPYGSPTIRNDLTVFDDAFGLPEPPSFQILQPLGPVPPFDPGNPVMVSAAGETTLDVELAHEIAPGANIVLVEFPLTATTANGDYLEAMTAENDVINDGLGDVFSQSFGKPEPDFGGPAAIWQLRFAYLNAYRHRVTMLASSGDSGASGPTPAGTSFDQRVVYWPASDPLVTGVGGTELHLTASGQRISPDTAWNDNGNPVVRKLAGSEYLWASGGGQSSVFSRPRYQDSVRQTVGDARGVPDIAMSASISGAVLVYESFTGIPGLWGPGGGTSAASPLFAGIVAIADQYAHTRLGLINPALYQLERQHAPGIVDVTQGNNTVSFTLNGAPVTVEGYPAKPGYDLVTGVGTVDAARFVPELAAADLHPAP